MGWVNLGVGLLSSTLTSGGTLPGGASSLAADKNLYISQTDVLSGAVVRRPSLMGVCVVLPGCYQPLILLLFLLLYRLRLFLLLHRILLLRLTLLLLLLRFTLLLLFLFSFLLLLLRFFFHLILCDYLKMEFPRSTSLFLFLFPLYS